MKKTKFAVATTVMLVVLAALAWIPNNTQFDPTYFTTNSFMISLKPGVGGGAGNDKIATNGGVGYSTTLRGITAADKVSATNFTGQLVGSLGSTGTLGQIVISARGIRNGLSTITNDGALFGPDTPGTATTGIQEALNSISRGSGWGTNVSGAHVYSGSGDFFYTNELFFSNTFISGIRLDGAAMLGTRWIYAGTKTTNCITFCGGGNPNGGLNLPLHVEVSHMTFTSISNGCVAFLVLTNGSYANVRDCNFTGWQITTNNLHGPQVSIDGPTPSLPPGNVGLVVGSELDHATFVEDCFFANLACGIDSHTDHFYGRGLKSAFIGGYDVGGDNFGGGTAWPTTSAYSLGPFLLFRGGLNVNLEDVHFYTVNGGIVFDGNVACFLSRPQWELADHPIAAFDPSAQQVFITESSISDDVSIYQVNHTPYSYSLTTAMDVRYALWSKMIDNTWINANGGKGTNFSLLSAAHISSPNIDAIVNAPDTNHIYVSGANVAAANGIYTWRNQPTPSIVIWSNTTGCGIILDRTGGAIAINDTDAFEITNSLGQHLYGRDSSQLTTGGALLVPIETPWEILSSGTAPTSVTWGTNYAPATAATPFLTGNYLSMAQAVSSIPKQLPINSVWTWNSNGFLWAISTFDNGGGSTTRTTNRLW